MAAIRAVCTGSESAAASLLVKHADLSPKARQPSATISRSSYWVQLFRAHKNAMVSGRIGANSGAGLRFELHVGWGMPIRAELD